MHRERAQGIDLFGHFHRPDFGRHRRPYPPCDHQARQDRSELAANGNRNDRAHGRSHPELVELKIRLGGEDRAGERARDHDHELRTQTDVDDLMLKQTPPNSVSNGGAAGFSGQEHDLAGVSEERKDFSAKGDEESSEHQALSGWVLVFGRSSGGMAPTNFGSRPSLRKVARISRKVTVGPSSSR